MKHIQSTVEVDGVPVYLGAITALPGIVSDKYSSVHVLADQHTLQHCGPALNGLSWSVPVHWVSMRAGESAKTIDTCMQVWRQLANQGADRHSMVINLGGGVITDLGGFCAATYMRGIHFGHVSTSVLGMVDAAIGGKHGVDLDGLKNYVGLFAAPEFVWIDRTFLQTLPTRHVRNGLAEVIKYGCIGNPQLLDMLEPDLDAISWDALLTAAIHVKKRFVEQDPREVGIRAALNFGHTIGHALETFALGAGYDLLHGEAVALGILVESEISRLVLGLPEGEVAMIRRAIRRIFPDLAMPSFPVNELLKLMRMDKKNRSGEARFSLISSIGAPSVNQAVSPDLIRRLISHDP